MDEEIKDCLSTCFGEGIRLTLHTAKAVGFLSG
jgi:hypothetical protein